MDKVRETLNLPSSVFSLKELGSGVEAGHEIKAQVSYFPPVEED